MSREYECHCHYCNTFNVRKDLLSDDITNHTVKYQCQCTRCGVNFIEEKVTHYIQLDTLGSDDKAWKKARKEMM